MKARLLAAALASLAATGACASARAPDAPPPLVLLVHGRGHQPRDSAEVRRDWMRALSEGGRSLGGAPALGDADVRMVWYADALGLRAAEACDDPPRRSARRRDPDADALADIAGVAETLIGGLLGAATGREVSVARGLFGELLFVADVGRRCAASRRLGDALTEASQAGRPVVLVAHSMGALVAYERLRDRAANGDTATPVRLVTLGSFLGHPDARTIVLGEGGDRRLRVPAGVRSWVNMLREGDPFAHTIGGAIARDPEGRARDVRLAEHGGTHGSHDARSYLGDPATARAVLGAWCQAYGRGAPRACRRVVTAR